METERHYYRCADCLEVQAVDGPRLAGKPVNGKWIWPACDCGGVLHWMGKVEGLRLIDRHLACPCDSRCTNAGGGHCDCSCGGANHGTRKLVRLVYDRGAVPVIAERADLHKRIALVIDFNVAKFSALLRIDAATHGALTAAGRVNRRDWQEKEDLFKQYRKARKYLTHERRMRALASVAMREMACA